jgi:hypothetical protein
MALYPLKLIKPPSFFGKSDSQLASWVGYGALHAPDSSEFQWRFPLAFQAVPALLLFVGMFWFPESPRHLVEKEKYEEALRILRKLHFDGSNEEWIQTEFAEIKATIDAERAITAPGWLIMFQVPQWRTRLMYGSPYNSSFENNINDIPNADTAPWSKSSRR